MGGGYLYWGNAGAFTTGTTIGRADLDGSHVDQHFLSGLLGPCSVAVAGAYFYWTNDRDVPPTEIGRAMLDGSGVNNYFINTADTAGCGVAISP